MSYGVWALAFMVQMVSEMGLRGFAWLLQALSGIGIMQNAQKEASICPQGVAIESVGGL